MVSDELKRNTQTIVYIQKQKDDLKQLLGHLDAGREKEEYIIRSTFEEMKRGRKELEFLVERINAQKRLIDELGSLNPMVVLAMEVYNKLTHQFDNLKKHVEFIEERMESLRRSLDISAQKDRELNENIDKISRKIYDLEKFQTECEANIKSLGIEHTKIEDMRLSLKNFKSRCESLLETIKMNIEFKDEMLNTQQEIINDIKKAYSKYGKDLPKGLLN
ncbi:hypothetical protein DICPUDRAFT_92232 [Dictyostelium purpureum]|uniref:Uncharacterized protein n=1 Tax=Dictyostelium purpureum TaxID=5786 RepID=F0ZNW4_DICPU|nr:uncharacterized protein DICPUDRAFT_92232 [Dictyostelium purpureum]EGC34379.1 hypothetical protein DICPUDRAFT_92232 [Dictyostelium purpureum]|eukprot:XP_003289113.1 hypothetical protein DICPUDRAFT_92232 [Dictyostelium purpureum]